MYQADLYVFLDNVQYRKNFFQNRNRISDGWLTVPVTVRGHTTSNIKDIHIDNSQPWQRKYWGRLANCYCKCPFWKKYAGELKAVIKTDYDYLVDINYALIEFFRKHFNITTPLVYASYLDVKGCESVLLLDICKKTEADTYLSGPSGRKYLNCDIFQKEGIKVEFHSFPSNGKPLSAIDFIMRYGYGNKTSNL